MKQSDLAVEWTGQLDTRTFEDVVEKGKLTIRRFQQDQPTHTYITIETTDFSTDHASDFKEAEKSLRDQLVDLLPGAFTKVYMTGLGNEWMSADALGLRVIQKLQQNYLFLEYEKAILLQPGGFNREKV